MSDTKKRIDVGSLASQLVDVKKVNVNMDQEVIMITVDKAELCLMKYLKTIESRKEWITPLGVFLTIILTLVTTSFKDFVLPADVWYSCFLMAGSLSFIWLGLSLYRRPQAKKIDDVILELKRATKKE